MNSTDFAQWFEKTLTAIEEAIDACGAPLDYENTGGILTIFCEDSDTQVIVSRQTPLKQIWVAARSGGYHCTGEEGVWRCTTTNEPLSVLLSRVCSEQSDEEISIQW